MSDSGSEGLGFESQRDHEVKRRIKYETRFQIFKAPFYFVGWQAPAYRDMQSQRDHERLKGFKEKSLLLTLWSLFSCRLKPVFKSIGASI